VKQVIQIATNNAAWCDLICRLHGCPGEFRQGLWLNLHVVPPFYPNAVTLAGDNASMAAALGALAGRPEISTWAAKDSFGRLDLSSFGLKRLFGAAWIARPAMLPVSESQLPGIQWRRIESVDDLDHWERAWRCAGGIPEDDAWKRIFPAALLAESDVAVLAAYRGGGIVAGAMANLAAGYVGLTNIFAAESDTAGVIAGCVHSASELFSGVPLAGYESGERLKVMKTLGFESIGPLAVWAKSAGSG